MKKVYLATLFLSSIFLNSCIKNFQNETPGSVSYSVSVSSRSITNNSIMHYTPNLSLSTSNLSKSPLTLSLGNLPAGMLDSPSSYVMNSNSSPIPTFTLNPNNIAAGTYQVQLNISTSGGNTNSYPFSLQVLPAANCVSYINFNHSYYVNDDYCANNTTYSSPLDSVIGTPNVFKVNNFLNLGSSVNLLVYIECGSMANNEMYLYVPKQTLNSTTSISGYGYLYYNNNEIYLYDSVTKNGITTYCNADIY